MKNIYLLLISFLIVSCQRNSEFEVYQTKRDNIIDVKSLIHEINTDTIYFSNNSWPSILGDYIAIEDFKSLDDVIHLFNKTNFKYVLSFGKFGQGPNEITLPGILSWNNISREILLTDLGKLKVLAFNVDSLINNKNYTQYEKFDINSDVIPNEYYYKNDTFTLCRVIEPIGNYDFNPITGIWNIKTGEYKLFPYKHSIIKSKRYLLSVSYSDSIYAECNIMYDLISIFDFKGNLIKNIYGPDWNNKGLKCFQNSVFTKDYLVAEYNGDIYEQHTPTKKCIIFSKNGDYIATLHIGYKIIKLCYDESNNRLIFTFDDEIQLGYLDLDEINFENK